MERSFYCDERAIIRESTPASPADVTGDRELPLDGFSRRQKRVAMDLTEKDGRRRRRTVDGHPSIHTIQSLIPERYSIFGLDGLQASASSISLRPADFEKIGKIGTHGDGEPDRNGKQAIVVDSQALEAASLPLEPSPRHVQRSARDLYLSLMRHIGIHEIDIE